MKSSSRWWLMILIFCVTMSTIRTQKTRRRRRKVKTTTVVTFVRGDDDDYYYPGKAGIFPYQDVDYGDARTSMNQDQIRTASRSPTAVAIYTTMRAIDIPTFTPMSSSGRNTLITDNPTDALGVSLFSPPGTVISRLLTASTQTNRSPESIPSRSASRENFTLQVNHDTTPHVASISLKSNGYRCPSFNAGVSQEYRRLCGYPLFYRPTDCESIFCEERPMKNCENTEGMIVFLVVTILLGLLIVGGNIILPCLVARRTEMRNNHNYIKVSLSFADMLCGFVLIATILPNVLKFRNASEKRIAEPTTDKNLSSTVAGALLAISLEASLLHLLFLSIERYLIIRWALKRDQFRRRTIASVLIVVWLVSIMVSIIPVMFPSAFSYVMLPVLFLSFPTATPQPDGSAGNQLTIYVCMVMLLPYVIMVLVCILTWLSVRWRRLKDQNLRSEIPGAQNQRRQGILNKFRRLMRGVSKPSPETTVFQTLLLMITAFSITLLPLMIVAILFTNGYYHCANYATPYTLSFYASISNSFVNVLIYTIRDPQFRKAILSKFRCCNNDAQGNLQTRNDQTSTEL